LSFITPRHNSLQLSCYQNEILRELIAEAGAELDAVQDETWPAVLDRLAESVSLQKAEALIDAKVVPLQKELGVDLSTVSH
jgi:hypothetical protein